jgi:hypothetical protein
MVDLWTLLPMDRLLWSMPRVHIIGDFSNAPGMEAVVHAIVTIITHVPMMPVIC